MENSKISNAHAHAKWRHIVAQSKMLTTSTPTAAACAATWATDSQ